MELAYMPVLETGFWEFESPLGHQVRGSSPMGRGQGLKHLAVWVRIPGSAPDQEQCRPGIVGQPLVPDSTPVGKLAKPSLSKGESLSVRI
jgi:hypothetical protein